jgi:hypothetical protein
MSLLVAQTIRKRKAKVNLQGFVAQFSPKRSNRCWSASV